MRQQNGDFTISPGDSTDFDDFSKSSLWWHISATRYEITIMIILENYCDNTNFPGKSIEIAKCFMIKYLDISNHYHILFYVHTHK